MAVAIKHTRGTAAAFTAWNGVLPDGVLAYEKNTGYAKFGDGVLNWNDLPYFGINAPDNLNFKVNKGIKGPSGLAGVIFGNDGNMFLDVGPGEASLFFKYETGGYNATRWFLESTTFSGYAANMIKLHTSGVPTTSAKTCFVCWDNHNGTYPMGWGYQWDGSAPSRSFNNWVGFVDDSTFWVFKVNDMCHAFAGQMQVTGQLTVKKTPNIGAITVTPQGTPGSTPYSYKAVAVNEDGTETAAETTGSTTTGHATLDGTNFNRIAFSANLIDGFMSPVKTFRVYRTAGGASQGKIFETNIGANAPFQFDDTGLPVLDGDTTPNAVNNSGNINVENGIKFLLAGVLPADGKLSAAQCVGIWNPDNVTPKIQFKAKKNDGTVVTAELLFA